MRTEPGISYRVFFRGIMLTTVYFDYHALFKTDEVCDITSYGFLSPEFKPFQLFCAKMLP